MTFSSTKLCARIFGDFAGMAAAGVVMIVFFAACALAGAVLMSGIGEPGARLPLILGATAGLGVAGWLLWRLARGPK